LLIIGGFNAKVYVYAIKIIYEYLDNQFMEFRNLSIKEKAREKKEFGKIVGKRIRDVRKAKGFTQEKIAEIAGYDVAYIGHLETGLYSPSVYTVWRIAKAINMDLGDFLKGL
jgi:DNA-binding XRE family transcriptional regulator